MDVDYQVMHTRIMKMINTLYKYHNVMSEQDKAVFALIVSIYPQLNVEKRLLGKQDESYLKLTQTLREVEIALRNLIRNNVK